MLPSSRRSSPLYACTPVARCQIGPGSLLRAVSQSCSLTPSTVALQQTRAIEANGSLHAPRTLVTSRLATRREVLLCLLGSNSVQVAQPHFSPGALFQLSRIHL